jgi:hypothetical protein
VLVEHPIFFVPVFLHRRKLLLARRALTRTGQPTKRGRHNAGPTCQAAECAGGRTTPQSTSEGRNPQMAKKAKGGKKKAAKKR